MPTIKKSINMLIHYCLLIGALLYLIFNLEYSLMTYIMIIVIGIILYLLFTNQKYYKIHELLKSKKFHEISQDEYLNLFQNLNKQTKLNLEKFPIFLGNYKNKKIVFGKPLSLTDKQYSRTIPESLLEYGEWGTTERICFHQIIFPIKLPIKSLIAIVENKKNYYDDEVKEIKSERFTIRSKDKINSKKLITKNLISKLLNFDKKYHIDHGWHFKTPIFLIFPDKFVFFRFHSISHRNKLNDILDDLIDIEKDIKFN